VGAAADAEAAVLREPDRLLPAANVGRIMARALPNGCKVSKCARKLMQECISELICFVTSEVIERCQQRQQRIMTAADFISAARDLDLAEFVPSAEAMKPCISSRLDHGRSLEALAFPIPAQLPLLEQHLAHPIYGGLTRDATSMATPTSSWRRLSPPLLTPRATALTCGSRRLKVAGGVATKGSEPKTTTSTTSRSKSCCARMTSTTSATRSKTTEPHALTLCEPSLHCVMKTSFTWAGVAARGRYGK